MTSLLAPHRSAQVGALWICTALLVGCSTPPTPPADAATPTSQAAPQVPPSVRVLSPAVLPLPEPPYPGSYAGQDRMRDLAQTLARRHALDPRWIESVLSHARFSAPVTRLIMPAANPGAKNWNVYRSRFVEPIRLRKGLAFWATYQPTLQRAAQQYGVPAEIIAAILGVETIYGEQTGQFRVLDALTTLSLDFPTGRRDRSAFFQEQLGEFLRLCAEQESDPREALGSYAGAIGWPQFMPSSIRKFAVDFDGDGHIDLSSSVPDAIGSVARFLSMHGWKTGQATHFAVTPPSSTEALAHLLAPDIVPTFKADDMLAKGATLDASARQHAGLLALVRVENGGAAPAYVAGTDNFFTITRYNHSSYYALSVIELAQAIASGQISSSIARPVASN